MLAAVLVTVAGAQARELHWQALDVRARLDAAGTLHVTERHAMVFTGDWNGGERVFRVGRGQSLSLQAVRRVNGSSQAHALALGDLSAVDQYAWKDGRTLRWRSRRPDDPSFDRTLLVYEIDYRLAGALLREGSRYLLDHDFAFPDRPGNIERFTLDLELDPAWSPEPGLTRHVEQTGLAPGRSVVVRAALDHRGPGRPLAGATSTSRGVRRAFAGALLLAVAGLYIRFRRREAARGRFAPSVPPARIDEAWLREHLLFLSPEEAGALWDGRVAGPEVAAILARLTAEGKLRSRVNGRTLELELLVPPESLEGYDRALVRALFVDGDRTTDSEAIRLRYRRRGFDPASTIRAGVNQKLADHVGGPAPVAPPDRRPALGVLVVGLGLAVLAVTVGGEDGGQVLSTVFLTGVLFLAGLIPAARFRSRIEREDLFSATFLWVPMAYLLLSVRGARSDPGVGLLFLAAVLLIRVALTELLLIFASTREGPGQQARRRALAAARRFFQDELGRPAPRLRDEWYPYLVGLGLGPNADRWLKVHGASTGDGSGSRESARSSSSSTSRPASSGSGEARPWTGGGGAFGGAGASGSWSVAAGALAAGVSAPSSSSGSSSSRGSSGSSGGSRSGGGGGGGW